MKKTLMLLILGASITGTTCWGQSSWSSPYNTKAALIGLRPSYPSAVGISLAVSTFAPADYSTKKALVSPRTTTTGVETLAATSSYAGSFYNTKQALTGSRLEQIEIAVVK